MDQKVKIESSHIDLSLKNMYDSNYPTDQKQKDGPHIVSNFCHKFLGRNKKYF